MNLPNAIYATEATEMKPFFNGFVINLTGEIKTREKQWVFSVNSVFSVAN